MIAAVLVILFFSIGVLLTLYPLVVVVYRAITGKTIRFSRPSYEDDEAKKQTVQLKKTADILERDRMERWTNPDYFKKL